MNYETALIKQYIQEDSCLKEEIARAAKYAETLNFDDCIRPAVAVLLKHHFEKQFNPPLGLGGDLILAGLSQVDWLKLAGEFVI